MLHLLKHWANPDRIGVCRPKGAKAGALAVRWVGIALRRDSSPAPSEGGFALIEVVVSALIAVTVAGGVMSLLNVSGRAGAELRHRSQAYSIAQEDQARLRGLQVTSLIGISEPPRPVTVGNTTYQVVSRGKFVNDKTAELSCSEGTGSADYIQIGSEVTWPTLKKDRKAVLIESIVTPPTGSLDPTRGTLVVNAVNAKGTPISAVGVTGTGPSTFTSSTDATGCAIFPNIPEGNYTVTPSYAAGFVNKDGEAPVAKTQGVTGGGTSTLRLEYDQAGTLDVGFSVRNYSGTIVASKADSIVYVNNQMKVAQKTMGSPGGTEKTSFAITPLYPFATSAYTVFAGCAKNDPEASEAKPSALVPAAGSTSATVRLHPLYVNVWTGRNSSNKGSAFSAADVWIRDDECSSALRRFATNSSGQLDDPGFPWSRYDVCADNQSSSSPRRQRYFDVDVKNLNGTTLNFYLGSGTSSASETGSCS